ncbi:uncharacterized protein LOC123450656 [Hordeum vulgare subsp. vulgare]|uniref:uncharacterized protein LOC123450656 n=1 Tax=Hordeum vulgare subsp. vulgare TaxID=112509 RepID=UPI001D1A3396|nr:uncharacterized protein LOC123450656 [Hordeum vulgare subsp. vulgare]
MKTYEDAARPIGAPLAGWRRPARLAGPNDNRWISTHLICPYEHVTKAWQGPARGRHAPVHHRTGPSAEEKGHCPAPFRPPSAIDDYCFQYDPPARKSRATARTHTAKCASSSRVKFGSFVREDSQMLFLTDMAHRSVSYKKTGPDRFNPEKTDSLSLFIGPNRQEKPAPFVSPSLRRLSLRRPEMRGEK